MSSWGSESGNSVLTMFGNSSRAFSTVFDFYRDVDGDRLKLIGAISLAWNSLENRIDFILMQALGLRPEVAIHVDSRINGMDGKVAIIKEAAKPYLSNLDDKDSLRIRKSLNAIEDLKRIRDSIIHMRVNYPAQNTVRTYKRRGKENNVHASNESLNNAYALISQLEMEIRVIVVVMKILLEGLDFGTEEQVLSRRERLLEALDLHRDVQTLRESLPPPPLEPPPFDNLLASLYLGDGLGGLPSGVLGERPATAEATPPEEK